jgi:hypothetical protein
MALERKHLQELQQLQLTADSGEGGGLVLMGLASFVSSCDRQGALVSPGGGLVSDVPPPSDVGALLIYQEFGFFWFIL